jgi:hypothetical protein
MEHPPLLSEKHNDNILRALLDGFYINLIKKTGNGKFINCYPKIKTIAGFTQDSLFSRVKVQYKYAFYSQLKSIFGKTSYTIISKIPPTLIEDIKKSRKNEYVESCWKNMEEEKDKDKEKHQKKHSKSTKTRTKTTTSKKFYKKI